MLLMIGTTGIIVSALIILLLFGGTQIPKLMRGIGKGVKSYKDGLNGVDDPADTEENKDKKPANNVEQ